MKVVQADPISNASGDLKDITNKDDARNPTCTKGRKRRLSEGENLDIITCMKGKVSVHMRIFTCEINALKQKTDIRIKFCDMKKRSVKISVKIRI